MRRWWLWVALMLSLGVNLGVLFMIAVHRQAPQRREAPARFAPQPPPINLLADRLRLRGRARDRFLQAQGEFFAEVTSRRMELATLRQELRRELISPTPDRGRIEEILERTGRATAELDGAFADNVLTVREILGPRQQRAYFRFLQRIRSGQR